MKATGKVIQIGTEIKGISFINFLNLLIILFPELALVLMMLMNDKHPPRIGRIPVGSGELISWNHNIPSVNIAGLIVKS